MVSALLFCSWLVLCGKFTIPGSLPRRHFLQTWGWGRGGRGEERCIDLYLFRGFLGGEWCRLAYPDCLIRANTPSFHTGLSIHSFTFLYSFALLKLDILLLGMSVEPLAQIFEQSTKRSSSNMLFQLRPLPSVVHAVGLVEAFSSPSWPGFSPSSLYILFYSFKQSNLKWINTRTKFLWPRQYISTNFFLYYRKKPEFTVL